MRENGHQKQSNNLPAAGSPPPDTTPRGADNFERFLQAVTEHPEKLQQMPALARELGIGESTAYKYRQRFAQLAQQPRQQPPRSPSNGQPAREGAGDTRKEAAQQRSEAAGAQLTPEEVDQEIAKILHMARRIRGFRRARPAMTDAEIAARLGIAVADIATTLRFEQGYLEIERRLHHQQTHNGAGERRSRK